MIKFEGNDLDFESNNWNEYKSQLKQIILDSYSYDFNDLYEPLSLNIIPIKIFSIIIMEINEFFTIPENTRVVPVPRLVFLRNSLRFINKFKKIYTKEMYVNSKWCFDSIHNKSMELYEPFDDVEKINLLIMMINDEYPLESLLLIMSVKIEEIITLSHIREVSHFIDDIINDSRCKDCKENRFEYVCSKCKNFSKVNIDYSKVIEYLGGTNVRTNKH